MKYEPSRLGWQANLKDVRPAYHGALDYVELERLDLNPETVLDFSVNSNPFGPSPLVSQALIQIPLDRYPRPGCLGLTPCFSRSNVRPDVTHWGG